MIVENDSFFMKITLGLQKFVQDFFSQTLFEENYIHITIVEKQKEIQSIIW